MKKIPKQIKLKKDLLDDPAGTIFALIGISTKEPHMYMQDHKYSLQFCEERPEWFEVLYEYQFEEGDYVLHKGKSNIVGLVCDTQPQCYLKHMHGNMNWIPFSELSPGTKEQYDAEGIPWKPKHGERYCYIAGTGKPEWTNHDTASSVHMSRVNLGNCFKTQEAAEYVGTTYFPEVFRLYKEEIRTRTIPAAFR